MGMIKIEDYRRTGRTSRLILLAKSTGATIVVPTFRQKDIIVKDAKEHYGIDGINVIAFNEFLDRQTIIKDKDEKFVIDDLDIILRWMNVDAYVIEKEKPRT